MPAENSQRWEIFQIQSQELEINISGSATYSISMKTNLKGLTGTRLKYVWIYIHYISKSIGSPPSNEQVWLL